MAEMTKFLAKMDESISSQFQAIDGHITQLQRKVFDTEPATGQLEVVQEADASNVQESPAPVTPPLPEPAAQAAATHPGKGNRVTPY